MNLYEHLQDEASQDSVPVINHHFKSNRIKGIYCNGIISLNKHLDTTAEKTCILAEELGHHYTSVGNILDQTIASNRKQEQQARTWAYNRLIGLIGIVNSYKAGCQNLYEMAEYLDVTEEFLHNALKRYREKYGEYVTIDNYIVYFEPCLGVLEIQTENNM